MMKKPRAGTKLICVLPYHPLDSYQPEVGAVYTVVKKGYRYATQMVLGPLPKQQREGRLYYNEDSFISWPDEIDLSIIKAEKRKVVNAKRKANADARRALQG